MKRIASSACCAAWLAACSMSTQAAAVPARCASAAAPVGAARPRLVQEALLDHVPADASFAVVVRRNALDWLLELLAGDAALKAELSQHFVENLGIDFTELRGLALVGFASAERFDAALYVHVPGATALFGPAASTHRSITLVSVNPQSGWVGAAVHDGVWIGHERAVRRALDHALDHTASLSLPLDGSELDVVGYLDPARSPPAALNRAAANYGIQRALLSVDAQRKLVLRLDGVDARITQAKVAITLGLKSALAQLEQDTRGDAASSPWSTALALIGYHQTRRFAEAITPQIEGTSLVSEYDLAPLLESAPVAAMASAFIVPAVLESMSSPSTNEAVGELSRVADALIAYHESTRAAAGNAQSHKPPPVALLRFDRTPAAIPCGVEVPWNEDDILAWQDIGYAPLTPMRYAIRVGPPIAFGRAGTPDTVLLIRAEGDLDCDGVTSELDLMLRLDAHGNLVRAGEVEGQNIGE